MKLVLNSGVELQNVTIEKESVDDVDSIIVIGFNIITDRGLKHASLIDSELKDCDNMTHSEFIDYLDNEIMTLED